jgi:hypothetical protein
LRENGVSFSLSSLFKYSLLFSSVFLWIAVDLIFQLFGGSQSEMGTRFSSLINFYFHLFFPTWTIIWRRVSAIINRRCDDDLSKKRKTLGKWKVDYEEGGRNQSIIFARFL